jgi:hypothetical protein
MTRPTVGSTWSAVGLVATVAVAVGAALLVVGQPDGPGSSQSPAAARAWSTFDSPPLSPRSLPMVSWTGREVVVFGGTALPMAADVSRTLDDGAIYDPARDAWRPMAEPPFDPPLGSPSGVWNGSELLVVGVPCGDQPTADAAREHCAPGGLRIGAFDPAANRWRPVEPPASLGPNAGLQAVEAIGATGAGSLFALDDRRWLLRPDGSWTELPEPPFRVRLTCVVGEELLAVGYTDDSSYLERLSDQEELDGAIEAPQTMPEQPSEMVAATLVVPDGAWAVVTRADPAAVAPDYLNSACAPDGAYVYSAEPADGRQGFARFDAIARSWREVASPPGRPGVNPPAVVAAGHLLVWADVLLDYDPDADGWTERPRAAAPATVIPAGDRAVLYSFLEGTVRYGTLRP